MTSEFKLRKRTGGPSLGAGYGRELLNFAVSRGANRRQLVELSDISPQVLESLDDRLPLARYEALMGAAAALTGEPAIALQFGESVRMQECSIVGLICEACETTADVGKQLNRYGRLVYDDGRGGAHDMIRLAHNAEGFWLEFVHPIFVDNRSLTECEFARLVWNARATFASNSQFQATPFPVAVHFTHAEPSYRAEYDRIFRAPLVFNSKWNAIRIDPSFLSLRQPPVSRYVFGLLSDRAEALLKNLEISQTVRGRIEGALIPILHTGELTMDMVARKLGLGHQTLYRALKAEDVTFKKLIDDLRHRMALHYLEGQRVSVSETAYLVGFSDPTAFSRAFKRWTGKSPRAPKVARLNRD